MGGLGFDLKFIYLFIIYFVIYILFHLVKSVEPIYNAFLGTSAIYGDQQYVFYLGFRPNYGGSRF